MNSFDSSEQRDVKERIQRTAGNLREKVRRMNISEDKRESILNNFDWLLRKRNEWPQIQQAAFFNDQVVHVLDLVDALSISSKLATPAVEGELAADSTSKATDEENDLTAWDQVAFNSYQGDIEQNGIGLLSRCDQELQLLQTGDHIRSVHHDPNESDKLVDFELDNRKVRLTIDSTEKERAIQLFAGAGVCPRSADITMEGVEASAQLIVRLDSLRKLIERALGEQPVNSI